MIKTETRDGFTLVTLTSDKIRATFMDLGATILSLCVRDRHGDWQDVVLGYESLTDYETYKGYLGAIIGRTANRIREGRFTLEGTTYQLPVNNGPNCNHGGEKGFAFRTFTVADTTEDSVTFALHSPDGEEGYPANLDVAVTYRIEGSTLVIEYDATPDGTTLVNLTNHAYFNLDGQATYIGAHWLEIQADAYGHVDGDILFTGETEDVTGTIFDFRKSRRIGEALESGDGQIETATGLDHPFLLNRETDAVRLYSEKTGISMTVSSSCPVCQIYSGNFLAGETGKDGQPMNRQTAVCIETSYAADDINIRNEQSKTIVKKGESWKEWTSFRFETDHESQRTEDKI